MLPSDLDAQFRTPYPRSAGFETNIGAFIKSSSVSSLLGPMAPLIINNDEVQGETFLPGQIFVFGGFALRGQFAWSSRADRKLRPWPSSQVWKLKLHGRFPRGLDLRRIRATAKRAALSRGARYSSASEQCPGGRMRSGPDPRFGARCVRWG